MSYVRGAIRDDGHYRYSARPEQSGDDAASQVHLVFPRCHRPVHLRAVKINIGEQ